MKCKPTCFIALLCLLAGSFSNIAPLSATGTKNPKDPLVEIQNIIPDAVLDVRYATQNNFLKQPLYPSAKVFLRKSTAEKLKMAADRLRKQGYRLKIFDGYRPPSVQKKMWAVLPDSRYVANPAKGSIHSRGGAVDLTLITLEGNNVVMPSDFDEFGEKAHHNNPHTPAEAQKNVSLLKAAMESAGFEALSTEWWHYTDPNTKSYPALDIGFDSLLKK